MKYLLLFIAFNAYAIGYNNNNNNRDWCSYQYSKCVKEEVNKGNRRNFKRCKLKLLNCKEEQP